MFIKRERWTDEHKDEQKGKLDEILNLGYKKMILVVYYTEKEVNTLSTIL